MATVDNQYPHPTHRTPFLRAQDESLNSRDMNILLMGSTGVGKTTFINALVNYIIHDSLAQGIQGEMKVLIPSSFTVTNRETFQDETVTIGEEDQYEHFSEQGQSATQMCRSFVFPIGERRIRIIDTPGICDTRGLDQDKKNLQQIFAYIAQFDYLNAICILLQPNEARLTVQFRFCVNELLRHLHSNAKDNLTFVFTHSRSTAYRPGSSKRLLQVLLQDHKKNHHIEIPFNITNTFLFDNEAFRCLALQKHNIDSDDDLSELYEKSWEHSAKEAIRFLSYVFKCPLHRVWDTLSLNDAEQLIQKLPRPIAETVRLIEENIQLAQQYKEQVLKNPTLLQKGIPQMMGYVRTLEFPRTVCSNASCCRVVDINGQKRIEYLQICHDDCFLRGVIQEVLGDERLVDCSAMDFRTGKLNRSLMNSKIDVRFLLLLFFQSLCRSLSVL